MPVSDYMALALGHPEYGYYRKADPLGRGGDFITAPEISQVFGEIIGLWCVVAWRQAGRPSPVHLVELGPGRGTLMADAMRAAGADPDFVAAADIHLVETSPALRKRQRQSLPSLDATWHDGIGTLPEGPCLYIANEFFDALPIDQYVKSSDGWHRRCIGLDPATGGLKFVVDPSAADTASIIPPCVDKAPAGSLFEHCSDGLEIASILGAHLAADGIAVLIIDYGHRRRNTGETLQAVHRHEYHDILRNPGEADLTAHVDFRALVAAAQSAGAVPFGPLSQREFLTTLGIEARTDKLAANQGTAEAKLLRSGCRRLIDAEGMGTLFAVLVLTRRKQGVPAGFERWAEKPDS
jgi:NADH dehydrogenase [ubiquinone] 1 alpha subcomplex assembly factor 7